MSTWHHSNMFIEHPYGIKRATGTSNKCLNFHFTTLFYSVVCGQEDRWIMPWSSKNYDKDVWKNSPALSNLLYKLKYQIEYISV